LQMSVNLWANRSSLMISACCSSSRYI
jgi:hypothetical protein